MKKVVLLLLIAGSCFALGQLANRLTSSSSEQFDLPSDYGKAPDFSLIDTSGEPFGSEDLQNKYYLVSFFFSSCQGPCPLINEQLRLIHDEFKERESFHLVSVSIDPKRDTVERLAEYSKRFLKQEGNWSFLTGTRAQITNLTENGYAKFPEKPDLHTTHLFLVNPAGRVIDIFRGSSTEEVARLKFSLRSVLLDS